MALGVGFLLVFLLLSTVFVVFVGFPHCSLHELLELFEGTFSAGFERSPRGKTQSSIRVHKFVVPQLTPCKSKVGICKMGGPLSI